MADERLKEVEAVLDRAVRPQLAAHGGGVEAVGLEDGVLSLRLLGACSGCPAADLSTRDFIEECLRDALPEIREIQLDHCVSEELLDAARAILRGGGPAGCGGNDEKG